jgi:simple sugar transport system permease protein
MQLVPEVGHIVESIIRLTTPILLAALGGLITQRAGIWNIGLEGFMLVGAFAGVVGSYYSGSPWIGLGSAILAGAALALLMAYVVVSMRVDQFIGGLAVNALASGLTTYLLIAIFNEQKAIISPRIIPLPSLRLPLIADVSALAPLSGQSPLVYASWLLVPLVWFFISRTGPGLQIRAVGDGIEAARAAGISPARIQYLALALSGALAGAAGAQLSIGFLKLFEENMSAGTGYIAFAAILFGNATPIGVAVASLVFAVAEEVALILVGTTIPNQIIQMTPYILAILALTFASAAVRFRASGRSLTWLERLGRHGARREETAVAGDVDPPGP